MVPLYSRQKAADPMEWLRTNNEILSGSAQGMLSSDNEDYSLFMDTLFPDVPQHQPPREEGVVPPTSGEAAASEPPPVVGPRSIPEPTEAVAQDRLSPLPPALSLPPPPKRQRIQSRMRERER